MIRSHIVTAHPLVSRPMFSKMVVFALNIVKTVAAEMADKTAMIRLRIFHLRKYRFCIYLLHPQ